MRFFLFLFWGMFLGNHVFAQMVDSVIKTASQVSFVSKDGIVKDLDAYARCIVHKHVHPFGSIKKSAFFEEIKQIKGAAGKYDADELLVKLMSVNALLQDEYTDIDYRTRDILPFSLFWFDEGIFVIGTNEKNTALLRSKLIAVNGKPIADVAKTIKGIIPNKNPQDVKAMVTHYLHDPFLIHGLGIAPTRTGVIYTFVTRANDTVNINPEAINQENTKCICACGDSVWLIHSTKEENWYEYFDGGNYVYFMYSHNYNKNNPAGRVWEQLAETIDSKKPGKIIIDLRRDNKGGYAQQLQPFITYLQRSPLNKKGKIFVLVGRGTSGSGIKNVEMFKKSTYATIVGELVGGSLNAYYGSEYFTLPETKLRVYYSTGYLDDKESYDELPVPDVITPITFADYIKNIDAPLQYAIEH